MIPLARPRSDVGNSSGPYTPMAGTTIAPAMAAAIDSPHIGQPPTRTMATVSSVPAATPKAPTRPAPARVGQPAADHEPDPAGRVGEDAEHGDLPAPRSPPRRGGTR